MRKSLLFLTAFVLLSCFSAQSQLNDRIADFDYLVKKIHDDYPGYYDKVTDATRPKLIALEKQLREKLATYPDSCLYYMRRYVDFFKDNHLRVSPVRQKSTQDNNQPEIMSVSTYGKNIYLNTDSLQQATISSKGVEGVWKNYRRELAIIKQERNKYAVVDIKSREWQPGQVVFELAATSDTTFNVVNHTLVKNGKTYLTLASLHLDGKVIEFHNSENFVRKSGLDVMDMATLVSYIPQHPNGSNHYVACMYLDDSTYYIRVPFFSDNTANELVKKHWSEIMARPNLIIDIRGNGGGRDEYYQELAKLVYSKPYENKGVEWYASTGNIKYQEDIIKNGKVTKGLEVYAQSLIDAMKKNVGGFVTHPDDAKNNDMVRRDTIYPMPRKVGIIINGNNASSAEQFLLAAKQSDKVTVFGNCNTAGVLDYSCCVTIPFPSNQYELYYPQARSKRLPEHPIDNTGIAPDVIIPFPTNGQVFDRIDDWAYFVKNYLELSDVKNSK